VRVRWFGQPWPSQDERASICDDDAFHVETPVGRACLYCSDLIGSGDRGIVMATEPRGNGWWTMEIVEDGDEFRLPVVATHIACLIRSTVGPEIAETVIREAGL
jgi:hypothetical protein